MGAPMTSDKLSSDNRQPSRIWSQSRLLLGLLLVLTASGGASCPQFLANYPTAGPRVLPQTSTLNDVISVVNENTAKIRTVHAPDASVSAPMTPSLRATLMIQRPRSFRVRAETLVTGPEVDLGSNDSLCWLWVKRSPTPGVFYCRHEQYPYSSVRQMIPVEPEWLIDAIGITGFDPAGQHSGPYPVGKGRLEIRTQLARREGTMTKITIIDSARAWVLEQHLYDARGTRIASSLTSQHWHDPESGVTLPKHIEIQWPATQTSLEITLRSLVINRPDIESDDWFALPNYPDAPPVDAGDPRFRLPTATLPPAAAQQAPAQQSRRWSLWR